MNNNQIQKITKEFLSYDLRRDLSGYANEFGGSSTNIFNNINELTNKGSNAKEYLNSFMQHLVHHRQGDTTFSTALYTNTLSQTTNHKIAFDSIDSKSDDVYFGLKDNGYNIVVSESGVYDLSTYIFIGGLTPINKTESVYLRLSVNDTDLYELDCKWLFVNIVGVGAGTYYFPISPLQGSKCDLHLTKDDFISITVYYTAGVGYTQWQINDVTMYGSINLKYSNTNHKRN